jgi:protocatechuate 3,4-dioxygenase beta subunit
MDKKNVGRRSFLGSLGISIGTGIIGSGFISPLTNSIPEECKVTPIQELGPYPAMKYRKQPDHDVDLTKIDGQPGIAVGQIITVFGRITDKNCNPVRSAIVEIWSANHYGKYRHEFAAKGQDDPNFQGWGQAITNENGQYSFKTILPAPYNSRARHIHFKTSKRGYHELVTQLYFEGEERNKTDGVLNQLTHEEQQLLIHPLVDKDGKKQIEFNIVIEEVLNGAVPEKVLKEYIGNYLLQNETFDIEKYAESVTGVKYTNIIMKLSNDKTQLYMTLPFSPKTEIGWVAKDEFQSWAFYNTFIRFKRDEMGKVTHLQLHFDEEHYIKGIRTRNNL